MTWAIDCIDALESATESAGRKGAAEGSALCGESALAPLAPAWPPEPACAAAGSLSELCARAPRGDDPEVACGGDPPVPLL